MNITTKTVIGASGLALAATLALTAASGRLKADASNNKLIINGQVLASKVKGPKGGPLEEVISGWHFRSPETQALETDDFENPAMPFVDRGADLWNTVDGSKGKSCASCHKKAEDTMKGVRAHMPKWNAKLGKPETLEMRINACRTANMGAKAWKWEAPEMLAMTAYIGLQSRGIPVQVQTDGPMKPWWEKGKKLYYTRAGQLGLACANCHEDNFGNMIRADHLSQGQINGFPVYRLKWGGLGSIHRRFKGCMKQVRAKPYKRGSDEFIALELYVASRGAGLAVETPAVRN